MVNSICWLVTKSVTVRVVINDKGIIIEAAPIVRTFIGQHFYRLTSWMRRFGNVSLEATRIER